MYCFFCPVLFQRLVRADPIFISLHVLLARRPARRLRVCLGCYSQSASYPADIPAGCRRSNRTACNAEVSQASELHRSIAQIHACHCVLHALGQHQTNELLLWDARMHVRHHNSHALGPHQSIELLLRDRPSSCSSLAFTSVLAIAG